MKLILGDNQFFGINHVDLDKARSTKEKFQNEDDIANFIHEALKEGMDGFMLNSNLTGFEVIKNYKFPTDKEIHYSIPYARKYATIVNEGGLLQLARYLFTNTSVRKSILPLLKFLLTRKFKHLVPVALNSEIPKNLPAGSIIFLQNIMTDFLMGLGQGELLHEFLKIIKTKGYRVGFVSLNPTLLIEELQRRNCLDKEIVVCFNINDSGFNVFPSLKEVESFIRSNNTKVTLMGMSIFSSGAGNIPSSINYIKSLNLDYVVFGSSNMINIKRNIDSFRN